MISLQVNQLSAKTIFLRIARFIISLTSPILDLTNSSSLVRSTTCHVLSHDIWQALWQSCCSCSSCLLTQKRKIQKELRHSVGNRHAEAFESKNSLMTQMGMHTSYLLNGIPGFLMVGIVKHKAHFIVMVVRADTDFIPKLHLYVPQRPSPIHFEIGHNPVEHIFTNLYKGSNHTELLFAPCALYIKAWKEQQYLEDCQQTVYGTITHVAFVSLSIYIITC